MKRKSNRKTAAVLVAVLLGIQIVMPVMIFADVEDLRQNAESLPPCEVVNYLMRTLDSQVALSVPQDWGNNGEESALTSYSPVNSSGAINPEAGTLNTAYSLMPAGDEISSLDEFVDNIEKLSLVSNVNTADAEASGCTARRISYTMTIGSNVFYCEDFCLAYEGSLYWVELLQGNKSTYNYYPVLDTVIDSLSTDGSVIEQAENEEPVETAEPTEVPEPTDTPVPTEVPEPTAAPVPTEVPEPTDTPVPTEVPEPTAAPVPTEVPEPTDTPVPTEAPEPTTAPVPTEVPEPTVAPEPTEMPETAEAEETSNAVEIPAGGVAEESDDLASFTYTMGGVTYQFPTAVSAITDLNFPLDRSLSLNAASITDASNIDTALGQTLYSRYSTDIYTELIGVTNISGQEVQTQDGVITALVDTQADHLDLTLPGNVRIGEPVINLTFSFPEFMNVSMDGEAVYRDDNTIYAANYKQDGCYGYVIIKGNAPYYSALSIVCDNGTIREISFECLGAEQMARFF